MNSIIEKLWDEYLSNKCHSIDTDEERELSKKSLELCEKANALLNKEQQTAVGRYVDAVIELEARFTKKAFLKGCDFASSALSGKLLRD